MKKKAKKKSISMAELTKNHDQFIKGKRTVNNGKGIFDKALNKAVGK